MMFTKTGEGFMAILQIVVGGFWEGGYSPYYLDAHMYKR